MLYEKAFYFAATRGRTVVPVNTTPPRRDFLYVASSEEPVPKGAEWTMSLLDEHGSVKPLEQIEAEVVVFTIAHVGGHMSEAARQLKIGRSTLFRYRTSAKERLRTS